MALTVAALGVGNTATTGTSATITLSTSVAVGDVIVVCIAQDNGGTSGAVSMQAPTDSAGHTYTQRRSQNYDPGNADAGITQGIYSTTATSAMSAGATITLRSSTTDAIAGAAWKITPGAGNTVDFATTGGTTGAATGSPTTTTGSLASGDAVIGVFSGETSNTVTADSDTSNGSWSTAQAARGNNSGTVASNVRVSSQYKVTTGAGTQTYNPTVTSCDCIVGYVTFVETTPPPPFAGPTIQYAGDTWATDWDYNGSGHPRVYIPASGVAADDVAYAAISVQNGQSLTTPSGWTLVAGSGGNPVNVYRKVLVSGDLGSSFTWTLSSAYYSVAVNLVIVRDADTTTPEDVVGSLNNVGWSNSALTATGPTSTVANTLGLGFFGSADSGGSFASTVASPWTEALDEPGSQSGVSTASLEVPSAGALDNAVWTPNGPGFLAGVILAVAPGAGALTATIGQVVETDTAQALARRKTRAVGQTVETDAAQTLARRHTRTIGQTVETDTAMALTRARSKVAGQTSETDTALAVTRRLPLSATIGQTVETDAAQPLGRRKSRLTGQTTETDSAGALGRLRARLVGIVAETDTARPAGRTKRKAAGQALETDAAQPASRRKARSIGQASGTDTAGLLGRIKARLTGQALETDSAQALTRAKRAAVGQPAETDTALSVSRLTSLGGTVGQNLETDTAQALTRAKRKATGQSSETDTARPAGRLRTRLVAMVTEVDVAQPASRVKRRAITQALETDGAGQLGRVKAHTLAMVVETDTARPATAQRLYRVAIGQAAETDTARPFTYVNASGAVTWSGVTGTGLVTTMPAAGAFDVDDARGGELAVAVPTGTGLTTPTISSSGLEAT